MTHLDEVSEGVVDVGSFRQEEATPWTDVIEEEQLLVLYQNVDIRDLWPEHFLQFTYVYDFF